MVYNHGITTACSGRRCAPPLMPGVGAPLRRRANAARIKDPLAGLRFATVNHRIEWTAAPPSTLDSASAAHPRGVSSPKGVCHAIATYA